MSRAFLSPVWLVLMSSALLAGCTSSEEEQLREWMAQERANAKPRVTPLEEPKPFKPQAYTGADGMDPFNPLKLIQVLRKESAQSNISTALLTATTSVVPSGGSIAPDQPIVAIAACAPVSER